MMPTGTQPHQAQERVVLPLGFIVFFSVLNGVMFPVAVPDISADFGLLPSEASWVITGYIVVFALGSLTYGKLADIYSVRALITAGILLLNFGSLLGLVSHWYPMLVAARLVQATGGAAIPALTMLVATRYLPAGIRGRVLGAMASTVALAMAVGPIVGGFVSGSLHWRYLFVATFATAFTIPAFRRMLPADGPKGGRFDLAGAILAGGAVTLLLLFLTESAWWFLPSALGLAVWFGVHIRGRRQAFVSPAILKNPTFMTIVSVTFLSIGSVFGMIFMTPIMLRELNGLGSDMIGMTIFPGAMCAALLGMVGGRLSDRRGSRFVALFGLTVLTVGLLLMSSLAGREAWMVAAGLVVIYIGFSFLQSSLPHAASVALPGGDAGVGMGIYNLFFFVSGAFMAAATGRLLDSGSAGFCLNPFCASEEAWLFSNLYLMLAGVAAAALLVFGLAGRPSMPLVDSRKDA